VPRLVQHAPARAPRVPEPPREIWRPQPLRARMERWDETAAGSTQQRCASEQQARAGHQAEHESQWQAILAVSSKRAQSGDWRSDTLVGSEAEHGHRSSTRFRLRRRSPAPIPSRCSPRSAVRLAPGRRALTRPPFSRASRRAQHEAPRAVT